MDNCFCMATWVLAHSDSRDSMTMQGVTGHGLVLVHDAGHGDWGQPDVGQGDLWKKDGGPGYCRQPDAEQGLWGQPDDRNIRDSPMLYRDTGDSLMLVQKKLGTAQCCTGTLGTA